MKDGRFQVRQKHFIFDPRHLERIENARIQLTQATKHPANPLMVEDRPWEIRWDDMKPNVGFNEQTGRFELWYTPFIEYAQYERLGLNPRDPKKWPPANLKLETHPRKFGLLYAFSDDGLNWTKPDLGVVSHRGSSRNNIVQIGGDGEDLAGPGVRFDPREKDGARRYKMIYGVPHLHTANNQGLGVAFSPDGIRWHSHQRVLGQNDWPMLYGDAHNSWLWCESSSRYVAFTQSWTDWSISRRIKLRTESEDFIHWTTPEPVRYDPLTEVHTHLPFAYGGTYLALLHVVTNKDGLGDGTIDIELGWSGDTRVWRRLAADQYVIPRGSAGEMDCGCVFAALAPIVRDDTIYLYYCGNDATIRGWRRGFWCLATLPRDRWASMAPEDPDVPARVGSLPCRLPLEELTVDGKTQREGRIVVRALAANGDVVAESAPFTGDDRNWRVQWLAPPKLDGPVRLSFELHRAELYSYEKPA